MQRSSRPGHPVLRAFIAVAVVHAGPLFAIPTFQVNSTQDGIDDDTSDGICHTIVNTCTLRAAVMQANRAGAGGATIVLPAGTYVLARPASVSDGEDNGDLNLTTPSVGNPTITISGAGAPTTIIDANQIDRAMKIETARTAVIRNLAIRGGYATGSGGGVLNAGILTLDGVVVGPQNEAAELGGGLSNEGQLTLRNTSVVGNVSGLGGGGLFNDKLARIVASTFALNTGFLGGGIYNYRQLTLIDSTITLNEALSDGGGIYGVENADAATNIYSSTIAGNDADEDRDGVGSGGGVYIASGNGNSGFALRNTLVTGNIYANSPQSDDCFSDSAAILESYGRNLFGTSAGCSISAITGTWNYFSGAIGQLQQNGGPTDTIALLPVSGNNAINGGDPVQGCIDDTASTIVTDQRGFARIVGSACDIGAYEFDPDRIFANGFE